MVPPLSPARRKLCEAERFNRAVRHENRGFLSWSRGFVPTEAPLQTLNSDFAAWDQLASELPSLYRDLSLRRRVEALPELDASDRRLDDRELLRATALLAIVAHAYFAVEPRPVQTLPPSLQRPWQVLRARLERSQEVLTYTDLIVYNWRVLDPDQPEPLRVENLDLLFPTIGNREERVFYLTQLEILARATGVVRAIVEAQDAVLRDDPEAVERALAEIIESLDRIVSESLLKINPNPYSEHHVDPVVWAKTVAPLAVPLHAGDQGPSGTSSPIFSALDLFFGRSKNASFLGREIVELRRHYPLFWRQFLDALSEVSVSEFVLATQSSHLEGALREALELYSGEQGFLGRHRMKVYGYLELAFKVGRSVTIGGFSGAFKDRTWDQVDGELEIARVERHVHRPAVCQQARVASVAPQPGKSSAGVFRVVLDVAEADVRFRVGSRCAVLPENRDAIVDKTLRALEATGDELTPLTQEWRSAVDLRLERAEGGLLKIRDLLRLGTIRPVIPRVAEALHALTQDPHILAQVRHGTSERWELWELLELLKRSGWCTRALWQDPSGQCDGRLARLIPPERPRLYSISRVEPDSPGKPLRSIELTVGELRYASEPARLTLRPPPSAQMESGGNQTPFGLDLIRYGTTSSFLIHALHDRRSVRFRIERPARFHPPFDRSTPIVLFAAGTGVAPYRALIRDRAHNAASGPCWLFLTLRAPREFLLGYELKGTAEAGTLRLRVAFTREGGSLKLDPEEGFVVVPGPRQRISDLLAEPGVEQELFEWVRSSAEGGRGATVYVCGRGGFAATVLRELEASFQRCFELEGPGRSDRATLLLRQLVGEGRLAFELHTDARPIADESRWISVSEVARHNDPEAGYWMIVDHVVYDLTEFAELHPGGRSIVRAHAGIDAGHAYARAHARQPDVDAMREIYRIGRIRPLRFENFAAPVQTPTGPARISCHAAYQAWVRALHLVVEMQNAHAADLGLEHSVVSPAEPADTTSAFKGSRAAEAHLRFLRNSLKPLSEETLPGLWSITRGVFSPHSSQDWIQRQLQEIRQEPSARYVRAVSFDLIEDFQAWLERRDQLARLLSSAREEDSRLLQDLKRELIQGVQVFEELQAQVRRLGAARLVERCQQAVISVQEYYLRLDARWRRICGVSPRKPRDPSSSHWPQVHRQRLHESEFWVLDEFPEQKIAVLYRTPVAALSLAALARDNDALLSVLSEGHRDFGLVVDIRQAPLRNDQAFEQTMAKVRGQLTAHFLRTAILLESSLGELQVTRLERDAESRTFITRSASAAFSFAMGTR